ncbi:MAG: nucleotide sugar dehydrogenase [Tissierellia bacterium]|nr:nucleotide sugar dehydrogenase [Tissierellia bacterium]
MVYIMNNKEICVVGLGYIGLPTSAMFATHGCKVHGVDVNEEVVNALNKGKIVIEEPYLDIMVQAAVRSGHLKADTKPQEADVFIIAVPTPLTKDKKADMSCVISAAETIVPYLRKDNLVILESTSPVGTVENLLVPILEKSGLKVGEELYVGHAPERVLPGKILWELVHNNRIVGGVNKKSAEKIRDLYRIFVNGEIYLTDATTAEMCKLMENTYRDVNIALANELAKICEENGINAWEVIELCNKHPRVNLHQPGPGVGGHCLAVDPWFIIEKSPELAKIITLSRETNDSMPEHVLNRIDDILEDIEGVKKVTILGITYKPNVDDTRESPILKLIDLLEARGDYDISVYDPHVKTYKYQAKDLIDASKNSDLIVLGVNHDIFRDLPLGDMGLVMRNKNLFDTRNFLDRHDVEEKGFNYWLLGEEKKSS